MSSMDLRSSVVSLPENYRFYFISPDGAQTTSNLYFERLNQSTHSIEKSFLGSIEFINSGTVDECFNLVYSSEKQKVDLFGGFIEEPDEETPYEFSTIFSVEEIEYSHYHSVNQHPGNFPFHLTLLRGFDEQDIENIRGFGENLNVCDLSTGAEEGEIIEIALNFDSIKDRVGQLHYLN
jgi:hypothetical protein